MAEKQRAKMYLTKMRACAVSLLLLSLIGSAPGPASAGEASASYRLHDFSTDLKNPWSLAFLPDGRVLVSELSGDFRLLSAEGKAGKPLGNVPEVAFASQGGLADVILDPNFERNSTIYFSYSAPASSGEGITLFVARARLTDTKLQNVQVILEANAPRRIPVHLGAKLAFAPDGTLFVTSGDGFNHREEAQSLDNHFGKILRINPDGSVPSDNPFVDTPDALPEIWSYGHRNMQGLLFTPDGDLYENEHGPRGGDEFNLIRKGRNYGWPAICYCLDYSFAVITPFTHAEGMEQPLKYWVPSIAPSGMAYYDGESFPEWQDSFFVTGLVPGDVRRLYPGPDGYEEETLFAEIGARIRNLYQTPDGNLMIVTDGLNGRLIEVEPKMARGK